ERVASRLINATLSVFSVTLWFDLLPPHNPKTIVRICVMRRQAAAMRSAGSFNLMAPGSAARDSTGSVFGTSGISFRTLTVVVLRIPVRTPFMDVIADVEQAITVGRPFGDRPWRSPGRTKVFNRPGRLVSPGVVAIFDAAPAGFLPLGFGWQPVLTGTRF